MPERYRRAVEAYVEQAVSHLGGDILAIHQCGEISEPGLSDIDLLVVLKNYRLEARPPWCKLALLNPEALSPLFTHGPFVCSGEQYRDLLAFTTLKTTPRWPRTAEPRPAGPDQRGRDPYCVLTMQSAAVLHLAHALPLASGRRRSLLLLRSLGHSVDVLGTLGAGRPSYAVFQRDVASCRKAFVDPKAAPGAREIVDLSAEAVRICAMLASDMGELIARAFTRGELSARGPLPPQDSTTELVESFRDAFFSHGLGCDPCPAGEPEIILDPARRSHLSDKFRFVSALLEDYGRHGFLQLGAELPFVHPHAARRLGRSIWIRRLLKGACRFIGRARRRS